MTESTTRSEERTGESASKPNLARSVSGPVYRIDAPHPHFGASAFASSLPPTPSFTPSFGIPANPSAAASSLPPVPTVPFASPGYTSPAGQPFPGANSMGSPHAGRGESGLLWQAGQLMEQMQAQFAELDRREQQIQAEWTRFEFEQRQARLQWQQNQADLQERETRLRSVEDELRTHQRLLETHAGQMEIRRRELEAAAVELVRQKSAFQESARAELAREREELEQLRESLAEEKKQLRELADLQALHQQERLAEAEKELQVERDHLLKELSDEWQTHRTEFEKQQAEFQQSRETWESTVSSQQTELQRERSLLENRLRFQQDHLEKSRQELESAQQTWRANRQQEMQRIQESWELQHRQRKQLQLQRMALDELGKSLARERELLEQSRQAMTTVVDDSRQNFEDEKETWEQQRQAQMQEVRRQQDILQAHAENLETRRSRLDQLRTELEETHRQTLEMRLAIEDVWARLLETSDDARIREHVEETRLAITENYQALHESLESRRRDLFDVQSRFEHQRMEFQSEKQTLIDWITIRDEQLRLQEAQIARLQTEWKDHESTWHTARDQWLQERLEAELVIRNLLQELTPTSSTTDGVVSNE